MRILVDAMGGDNAPHEIVLGCIQAIREQEGFEINLIGKEEEIQKILSDNNFKNNRLKITNTREIVSSDDSPTKAIKQKKDSSMVVGFNMLKEKKGEAFISSGNTGALLAGGLLLLGRIEGVDRPALTTIMPTKTGISLVLDVGANTMCKPLNYLQFACMGSIYMQEVYGIKNPKVGLVNVGTEEKKGTDIVKQAYDLLKTSNINFIGNIEGRDIPMGTADVAVMDGFVGNVSLKVIEGMASFFNGSLKEIFYKNLLTKAAALTLKSEFKKFMSRIDYEEIGGVPLLGVNGCVFKCHGSAHAKSIKNSIQSVRKFTEKSVIKLLNEEFKNVEIETF